MATGRPWGLDGPPIRPRLGLHWRRTRPTHALRRARAALLRTKNTDNYKNKCYFRPNGGNSLPSYSVGGPSVVCGACAGRRARRERSPNASAAPTRKQCSQGRATLRRRAPTQTAEKSDGPPKRCTRPQNVAALIAPWVRARHLSCECITKCTVDGSGASYLDISSWEALTLPIRHPRRRTCSQTSAKRRKFSNRQSYGRPQRRLRRMREAPSAS